MKNLGSWLKQPSYFFDDYTKLSGVIILTISLLVTAIVLVGLNAMGPEVLI